MGLSTVLIPLIHCSDLSMFDAILENDVSISLINRGLVLVYSLIRLQCSNTDKLIGMPPGLRTLDGRATN